MEPLNAEASGAMDAIASTVPLTPAHLVAMAAGFLTVGYFLGRTTHKPLTTTTASRVSSDSATGVADGAPAPSEKRRRRKEPLELDRLAESYEDFKMVRPEYFDQSCNKHMENVACFESSMARSGRIYTGYLILCNRHLK